MRKGRGERAVLFVGQDPGRNEDAVGEVFVGLSGKLLEHAYLACIPEDIDVWVTNSVKCVPPVKAKAKVKHLKACNEHLWTDVEGLASRYTSFVIVCLGANAAKSVLDTALGSAFSRQGKEVTTLPWAGRTETSTKTGALKIKYGGRELSRPIPVFATYHPAWLARDNTAGNRAAIKDHLGLVARFFDGEAERAAYQLKEVSALEFRERVLASPSPYVWLDIETYGIWDGIEQTVHHPIRSALVDGVPVGKQIVSIALLMEAAPDEYVACSAAWTPSTRKVVADILKYLETAKGTLAATFSLFDLSYLAAEFPWWFPEETRLEDLCVWSFLQNPDRPEGSLKDLQVLLLPEGIGEKYGPKGQKYKSIKDILAYNLKDVLNPPLIVKVLRKRMEQSGWPKNLNAALDFYSDEIKTLLHMTMCGVAIDREQRAIMEARLSKRAARLSSYCKEKLDFPLVGKGSGLASRALFNEIVTHVDTGPMGGWELTKSEENPQISTAAGNIRRAKLLRKELPRLAYRKVRALSRYRKLLKDLSSYLVPLGEYTKKTNLVYPRWFPIPSRFDSGDDSFSATGGTRQVRVTCKSPALQTAPAQIKKLLVSRYPGGVLVGFDYKNLEMFVGAVRSGDENMLAALPPFGDPHAETMKKHYGREIPKTEPGYDIKRRNAKYANFGCGMYDGGPKAVQIQAWNKDGVWLEWSTLKAFKDAFEAAYPQYVRWRNNWYTVVARDGALELPITGHWLPFARPNGRDEPDKAILNFPTQGPAAALCLAAHALVRKELKVRRWGVTPLNVYDSIVVDFKNRAAAASGIPIVRGIMEENWYTRRLGELSGRTVRFPVDYKVLSGRLL